MISLNNQQRERSNKGDKDPNHRYYYSKNGSSYRRGRGENTSTTEQAHEGEEDNGIDKTLTTLILQIVINAAGTSLQLSHLFQPLKHKRQSRRITLRRQNKEKKIAHPDTLLS